MLAYKHSSRRVLREMMKGHYNSLCAPGSEARADMELNMQRILSKSAADTGKGAAFYLAPGLPGGERGGAFDDLVSALFFVLRDGWVEWLLTHPWQ